VTANKPDFHIHNLLSAARGSEGDTDFDINKTKTKLIRTSVLTPLPMINNVNLHHTGRQPPTCSVGQVYDAWRLSRYHQVRHYDICQPWLTAMKK